MKIKLSRITMLVMLLLSIFGNTKVYADETPLQAQLPITVETSTSAITPTPAPTATTAPAPAIVLYPIEVQEFVVNDGRQLIKVYELSASEHPKDIPTTTFERDGWRYSLTDIIKKETAAADLKEHIETITADTDTKDMDAILKQLAPTIDYKTEDGYAGVLQLDISSIKCETAGYKNSNYTVTATREYPHLSQNDTSLVPKTINDNGKTLTLASVSWQAQNTTAVDYSPIPDSYKAIAKYTATGTKTSVTGYTTTAEYKGSISKLITGKTVYTAYFIGKEIAPPTPAPTPTPEPIPEPPKSSSLPIAAAAATATTGTGLIGGFVFFFFLRRNVKVFNLRSGKYEPIGKVRVSYKNPVIDLTGFTEKASTGSFILVLDKFAAKKLNTLMITVNYGEKSFQHIVDGSDGEYQFEVDF